jgi:DNA-directed RNA polymerase alpha subunit
MGKSKGFVHICPKGHPYYKSSSCPVCPICEKGKTQIADFVQGLSAPARRALASRHIKTIEELAFYSEAEILALHGIGPSSLPTLQNALKKKGLSFKRK